MSTLCLDGALPCLDDVNVIMGDRPPGGASRGRGDISWEIDRQVGLVEEGVIYHGRSTARWG